MGEDDYRSTQRLRYYAQQFAEKYPEGTLTHLSAEHTVTDLQQAVLSVGLFASRSLVICRGFWTPEKYDAAEKMGLLTTLETVTDTTVVFFPEKIDKRLRWSKYLLASCTVENYPLLEQPELLQWVLTQAQQRGLTLSSTMASTLLSWCGENLWHLHQEIEKLAQHGGPVTPALVETLCLPHPEAIIWDFTEALSRREEAKALQQLERLLSAGESPYTVLAMMQREIRILTQLRYALDHHTDGIAKATGLHPFVVQKTVPLAKYFTMTELREFYGQLLEADTAMKSGGVTSEADDDRELYQLLLSLITRICRS